MVNVIFLMDGCKQDRSAYIAALNMSFAKRKEAAGEIHIAPESCCKRFVRFTTEAMSRILPDASEPLSGWGTRNYYFYEIINSAGKAVFMQLTLSMKDLPDDRKEICERISKHFPSRQQKTNLLWRYPFVTERARITENSTEEEILQILNDQYSWLQKFERRLMKQMGSEKRQEKGALSWQRVQDVGKK